MSALEPKKKRRQNVACDSCKLRRIKCDLFSILIPRASDSISESTDEPSLSDLVLANPDVQCSNCVNKEIRCTTAQIVNPSKPKKGGKRIDEARQLFGEGEGSGDSRRESGDANYMDITRTQETVVNSNGFFTGTAIGGLLSESSLFPSQPDLFASMDDGFSQQQQTHQVPFDFAMLDNFNMMQVQSIQIPEISMDPGTSTSNQGLPWDELFVAATPNVDYVSPPSRNGNQNHDQPPSSVKTTAAAPSVNQASSTTGEAGRKDIKEEAEQLWSKLMLTPKLSAECAKEVAKEVASENVINPNQPGLVSVDPTFILHGSHSVGPSPLAFVLQDMVYDSASDRYLSSDIAKRPVFSAHVKSDHVIDISYSTKSDPWPGEAHSSFSQITASPSGSNANSSERLKRSRSESRQPSESQMELRAPSAAELTGPQAWRLYEDRQEERQLSWARREDLGERMADKALGLALSQHLIKVFFQSVHLSLPALSPEVFYMEWQRAGQRTDRMTPALETLAGVIEAWAARYSDSPVILGLQGIKASTAPKVITEDGRWLPGTQARAHWGRARLPACNALLQRAQKLIDHHGIIRKPSVTGLQALAVFSLLRHVGDSKAGSMESAYEAQILHTAVIEQMSILGLLWDTSKPLPTDENELPTSVGQMRMKQRRMFFSMMVSDALWAASTGNAPKIPAEELEACGAWIDVVVATLPASEFKTLAFFMKCFHRITMVGRDVAYKLSVPARRPGAVNVEEFCHSVRDIWQRTKEMNDQLNEQTTALLEQCSQTLVGFSPIHHLANLRLSSLTTFLIIHQIISDQLTFRRNLTAAFIYDDSSTSSSNPEKRNLAFLEELRMQSIDIALHACRSQIDMFQELRPTGIIQTASVVIRVLIASTQLLSEVPCNEQGYPASTLGGLGWTWANKQTEVAQCVESLYQIGWAWGDIADVLDNVMVVMERMAPTPDQIASYRNTAPLPDTTVVSVKQKSSDTGTAAVKAAMKFWPPIPVPMDSSDRGPASVLIGYEDMGSVDLATHAKMPASQADVHASPQLRLGEQQSMSSSSSSSPSDSGFPDTLGRKRPRFDGSSLNYSETLSAANLTGSIPAAVRPDKTPFEAVFGANVLMPNLAGRLIPNDRTGSVFGTPYDAQYTPPAAGDPWERYSASANAIANASPSQIQQAIQANMAEFRSFRDHSSSVSQANQAFEQMTVESLPVNINFGNDIGSSGDDDWWKGFSAAVSGSGAEHLGSS